MKRHAVVLAAISWFWMACPLWCKCFGASIWLPDGSFLTSSHAAGDAQFRTRAKDLVVDESRLLFYTSSGPPQICFAAALRSDLKPGLAVGPGQPNDVILFAWQPPGGWRGFVVSGDKKDLVAYIRSVSASRVRPIPNEKPPQAAAWQITAFFRATVVPDDTGEIRRLGPTVTELRLAPEDSLWVILRFPAGQKKTFTALPS